VTPPPREEPAQRAFSPGTPQQQQKVQEAIASFEREDLRERLEASSLLARIGEPALPALMEAVASHPSARTRGMAAYTLGFLRDHRALDPLARALRDPDQDVRLEAATALLRLSDDRGLAPLVAGLEDTDPRVRARSILVLQQFVGQSWGYAPDDDPMDRQAAVARWKGWLQERRERGR
jgi:HEAT repeat protein